MNDRLIDIVQDHALLTDFINDLCAAVRNPELGVPNYIPVFNDGLIGTELEEIVMYIKETRSRA